MEYFIGILLIFIGEPLSAFGQVLQKKYHNLHKDHYPGYEKRWYNSKLFWFYYVIEYIGSLLTNFSLIFIPIIIFIPLTNFRLVVNIYFSKKVLNETIYRSDYVATLIIFAGSFLVIYFGNHPIAQFNEEMLITNFSNPRFIVTTFLYLTIFGISTYLYKKTDKIILRRTSYTYSINRTSVTNILLKCRFTSICLLSSIISALSSLLSNLLIMSLPAIVQNNFSWDIVKCTILIGFFSIILFTVNLIIFQQLIKKFKSILLFPVTHILHVVLSIIYSIIFFKILRDIDSREIGIFVLGVIISLVGVFIKTIHHLNIDNMRRIDSAPEISDTSDQLSNDSSACLNVESI